MDGVGIIVAVVLTGWLFLLLEAPFFAWVIAAALAMLALFYINVISIAALPVWLVGIGVLCAGLGCSFIRQKWLTPMLYHWFARVLPPMSETEKQAIQAGDTWWESDLFQGKPNWKQFLEKPVFKLTQEEISFLNNETETLCEMLDDWDITHENLDLPQEVWQYLKKEGFFAFIIPKEYGGKGFSSLANSTIVQKIASRSLTAAVTVMVPNSLGPGELLLHYGTSQQRQHYLPRLAKGQEIPCFALTSVEAGSDATAIIDEGIICRGLFEGKEVLGIRLTWNKRYITLAPVATVMGLAVKLRDPDQLLGNKVNLGITTLLLPTSLEGIEIGQRHFPLNQAFMNGPIRGKDVFVPLDYVIGGREQIGQGWRMLVECLSAGRGISLPALSTAAGKMAYRVTGAYAKVRKQFNTSIAKFEGVEALMAKIAGSTYLLEAMRRLTIDSLMEGYKPGIVTAMAKYHMTEIGRQVITDAMDIHGGRGIMLGPRNYLGRSYQGMPIGITVEGANVLTRNLMIFGQGAVRCHPFVKEEIAAVQNTNKKAGIKAFDMAFFGHVHYSLSNFMRLLTHGLLLHKAYCTGLRGFRRCYARKLSRMSLALAFVSDIAMLILGGSLKRKERLSARLGDVLSYLFMSSAVLKYHTVHARDVEDKVYAKWCLDTCLYNIQEAFVKFFDNFPNRIIGIGLRYLVFPWGLPFKKPKDKLEQQLVDEMLKASQFRDRLTAYCYTNLSQADPIGKVENAFRRMLSVEPILKKIDIAVKRGCIPKETDMVLKIRLAREENIITEEDTVLLKEFEALRIDAIEVDEFSHEQLLGRF